MNTFDCFALVVALAMIGIFGYACADCRSRVCPGGQQPSLGYHYDCNCVTPAKKAGE
jgi:hypothetical protein